MAVPVLQHLKHLAAERRREVAEFQVGTAPAGLAEITPRRLVRVQNGQVLADDHAGAAQLAEDVRHHLVARGQLVVHPDVLDRQAEFLQQMENHLQFAVEQRLARHPAVKHRHADQRFPVQNRHRHLRAQQLEFLLDFHVRPRLLAVAPQNPAGTAQSARRCPPPTKARNVPAGRRRRPMAQPLRRLPLAPRPVSCRTASPVPARKIAARLTPTISRNSSRNLLSIASASSECVRMAEKCRENSSA